MINIPVDLTMEGETLNDLIQFVFPNLENYQAHLNNVFPPCCQCMVEGIRTQVSKKPATKNVRFRSGVA